MSGLDGAATGSSLSGPRRVRHEVRDGIAVMAFSAGTSAVLALLLTVLTGLGK
jgi:hypothetical protein